MSTRCKVVTPSVCRIGSVDPRVLTNGTTTPLIRFKGFPVGDSTWSTGLFRTFLAHLLHWMSHFLWTKPAISVNEVNRYTQTNAVAQWQCFSAWRLRGESRGNQVEQSRMTSPTLRSCTVVSKKHWVEMNPVEANSAVMEKHHKIRTWTGHIEPLTSRDTETPKAPMILHTINDPRGRMGVDDTTIPVFY